MIENRRIVSDGWATGLTGTIAVRLVSASGVQILARTTTGITEDPVGSGRYVKVVAVDVDDYPIEHVWDNGLEFVSGLLTNEISKQKVRDGLNGRWTDELGNDFDLTVTDPV